MQLITLSVVVSSLLAVCFAAPANNHALIPRQTYTITCIGDNCDDGPKPTPTPPPKPTSSSSIKKTDPPKTTSKYTPSPPPVTPSKTTKYTTKSTVQPSKTGGEGGPSSTACPVPLYYQCGGYYDGKPWTGCTKCVKGAKCVVQNEFYDQCVADE